MIVFYIKIKNIVFIPSKFTNLNLRVRSIKPKMIIYKTTIPASGQKEPPVIKFSPEAVYFTKFSVFIRINKIQV